MRWYVIATKDRDIAIENLRNMGFETYLPLLRVNDKRGVSRLVSMFGGYMFVRFDIKADGWGRIWNTRGVRRILCMDEESPSPVREGVVEEMMRQTLEKGCVADVSRVFSVGNKLRITDGAFKGHEGICAFSSGKRVAILLHLLGGENKVYIDSDHIEQV